MRESYTELRALVADSELSGIRPVRPGLLKAFRFDPAGDREFAAVFRAHTGRPLPRQLRVVRALDRFLAAATRSGLREVISPWELLSSTLLVDRALAYEERIPEADLVAFGTYDEFLETLRRKGTKWQVVTVLLCQPEEIEQPLEYTLLDGYLNALAGPLQYWAEYHRRFVRLAYRALEWIDDQRRHGIRLIRSS